MPNKNLKHTPKIVLGQQPRRNYVLIRCHLIQNKNATSDRIKTPKEHAGGGHGSGEETRVRDPTAVLVERNTGG